MRRFIGMAQAFMILFQCLFLNVEQDVEQHLWSKRLVVGEVLDVQFVETLQCTIVGERALVFGHLLPCCTDFGNPAVVDRRDKCLDHWCHCVTQQCLSLVPFGLCVLEYFDFELLHLLDELSPQCVVRQLIESLKVWLVDGRSPQGKTVSLSEHFYDLVPDDSAFTRKMSASNRFRILFQAVLKIILRLFVPELKSKIPQQPQKLRHVLVQILFIFPRRNIIRNEYVLAQSANKVQLLNGTLNNRTHRVENKVSRDQAAQSKEFYVSLCILWEGLRAFGVEKEQVALVLIAVEWPGPHPDALSALFGFVGHFEALAWEVEHPVEQRWLADTILADKRNKANWQVALSDNVKRLGVDFDFFGRFMEPNQLNGKTLFLVLLLILIRTFGALHLREIGFRVLKLLLEVFVFVHFVWVLG